MITRPLAAAGIVAVAVALAGCGLVQKTIDDAVGNVVEEGVERAIEKEISGDVDVEYGADADLPADFPGSVPVPDGARIVASLGNEDGWWVTFESDDPDAGAKLFAKFGGWELVGEMDADGYALRHYTDGTYQVSASAQWDGQTSTLLVAVVPAE